MIGFDLNVFSKERGGALVHSEPISATPQDVNYAFGLGEEEYCGDCLEVTPELVPWLKSKGCSLIFFDFNNNEYWLDVYEE